MLGPRKTTLEVKNGNRGFKIAFIAFLKGVRGTVQKNVNMVVYQRTDGTRDYVEVDNSWVSEILVFSGTNIS